MTIPGLTRRLHRGNCKGFCISNWGEADPVLLQRNGIYFYIAYMSCIKNGVLQENAPFFESVVKVSDILFRQRLSQTKQKCIRVVHTANIIVDHRDFVDGNYMDFEKDYLGSYKIVYEDGKVQYERIYFGLNINYGERSYERKTDSNFDLYDTEKYLLESTWSCRYILKGNVTAYEYAFPRLSENKVLSWDFLFAKGRENSVKVLSFLVE